MERSDKDRIGLEKQVIVDYALARPARLPCGHVFSGLWRGVWSGAAAAALGLVLSFGSTGLDVSVSGTSAHVRTNASQPTAAAPLVVQATQALPGLSSETLTSSDPDKSDSKAERLKARKEAARAKREAAKQAAKAKREAARERYAAAAEARREKAAERKEAAKAKKEAARERYAAATQARREAAEQRKQAAKAKREAAQARRDAASERNETADAKKEARRERYAAAMQARREAAEERREAAKAKKEAARERYVAAREARREAAEERRRAAQERKEQAAAAREQRSAAPESGSFIARANAAPVPTGTVLRINSLPWAQVFVDGQLVGTTPLRGLSVTPGEHQVRLVNTAFDMSKTFSVKVARGQRVTRGVTLEE